VEGGGRWRVERASTTQIGTMTSLPQRRSSRRQTPIKSTGALSHWRRLSSLWRQQFIDLGHGRISRCTRRLVDATDSQRQELREMELSFVALAITSGASSTLYPQYLLMNVLSDYLVAIPFLGVNYTAASVSGRARIQKEQDAKQYITTAMRFDLDVNDDHNEESAINLAAYHGFTEILIQLLDEANCSLRKITSRGNPIFSAIRNGQHNALEIIMSKRTTEAIQVINQEEDIAQRTRKYLVSAQEVVMKVDVRSAEILLSYSAISISDRLAMCLYEPFNAKLRYYRKLENLLTHVHPMINNVKHWRKELHWSFPTTDKETINWLWYVLQRSDNEKVIPIEMWLRVFSYFGRGWFAFRRYDGLRSDSDVSEHNIIQG